VINSIVMSTKLLWTKNCKQKQHKLYLA